VFWDSRSFIFLSLLHSHSGLVFVSVGGCLSLPANLYTLRENRTKHTCTPPSCLDYNKNFNWRKWKSWNLEGGKAFKIPSSLPDLTNYVGDTSGSNTDLHSNSDCLVSSKLNLFG
jgi:hypothetical protein